MPPKRTTADLPAPSIARDLAAEVLLRVERDQAYANAALQAALDGQPALDPRDAALASELVFGTLRWQLALDHALEAAAGRPMARLEVGVRVILREAAYQLLHMDRVPARAAVHEAVELAKAHGLGRAAGLVNAVLRQLQRGPTPPLPADPVLRLAIEQSHPAWLVRRWAERFGLDEARSLCEADNAPAPLTLRVNAARGNAGDLAARLRRERPDARVEPGRFSPVALRLHGAGPVARLPGLREGLFQVQDEAAQLVSLYAAPAEGQVLDVCAAPGGKACHLAELGGRPVVALDLSPRKLGRVAAEARRLGHSVDCVAADARLPLPVPAGSQRLVLVDAPCSGLGTLRRHPELRWRRVPEDPARLAPLQWQILTAAADAVAPGGRLVYAVCSGEPEEGPDQLLRLLAERPEFEVERPPAGWAGDAAVLCTSPPTDRRGANVPEGALATWPHRHGVDGFFAFRVRRAR